MSGEEVFESFNNAWFALVELMRANPTANTQYAMNIVGRILNKVRAEMDRAARDADLHECDGGIQISIKEWIEQLGR